MRGPEERSLALELGFLMHDAPFAFHRREYCMDMRTLFRRAANEGLRFFTTTLAELGKALVAALSGDRIFQLPTSFKKKRGCAYPRFLGSAFERVLDCDGYLLPEGKICHKTVRWLRTFLMYAYKVEVPFTELQTQTFSENFITSDAEIGDLQKFDPIALPDEFGKVTSLMKSQLGEIFHGYDNTSLRPFFGPGVHAEKDRRERYFFSARVRRTTVFRHFGDNYFGTSQERAYWALLGSEFRTFRHFVACLLAGVTSEPERLLTGFLRMDPVDTVVDSSKVLFVPKDSRGPRVIAAEPSYNMYMQQAVRTAMQHCMEEHARTRGHVNFTDQTINQKLLWDDRYATLDLKDASDRVPKDLVWELFPSPLKEDMFACRTPSALLPDGRCVELKKFAPMGSALCFPTMAVFIYTAILAGVYLHHGILPRYNTQVYVYGDDIILPSEWAESAIWALELVGLKVNKDKSFVYSRFRESCGLDVLDSENVTPFKKRKLFRGLKQSKYRGRRVVSDGGWASSTVDLANRLWEAGYSSLAYCLQSQVESVFGELPLGKPESGYLCWWSAKEPEEIWSSSPPKGVRAWFVMDGEVKLLHTEQSRVRAAIQLAGSQEPETWSRLGMRSPFYALTPTTKWWKGVYVPKKKSWDRMLVRGG